MKRGLQNLIAAVLFTPGLRQGIRWLARKRILPRKVWVRMPVTGPFVVEVPGEGKFIYRCTLMDQLGRVLFYRGSSAYEPEILRVLPALARTARGVIDVGAHTGLFTLLALVCNPKASAIAIEPVLNNAKMIEANLDANKMQARCLLVVAAAGAELSVVPFNRGSDVEIPMTASMRADSAGAAEQPSERVLTVSIDELAPFLGPVDLIKIDVEGFEDLVLKGAQATLERHRPTMIVECLPGSRIETFGPLWERLGYKRFHLLPDGQRELARIEPATGDPTFNYLLTAARPS
jgi:FkbM family methyltransferase